MRSREVFGVGRCRARWFAPWNRFDALVSARRGSSRCPPPEWARRWLAPGSRGVLDVEETIRHRRARRANRVMPRRPWRIAETSSTPAAELLRQLGHRRLGVEGLADDPDFGALGRPSTVATAHPIVAVPAPARSYATVEGGVEQRTQGIGVIGGPGAVAALVLRRLLPQALIRSSAEPVTSP